MVGRLKILFVCSKNKWRSPTAESLYRAHPLLDVRSAGTSPTARRRVTARDLEWADLVLVMEHKHKERLHNQYPQLSRNCRFEILDIEDRFRAMDPRLIEEIKESTTPLIEEALSD